MQVRYPTNNGWKTTKKPQELEQKVLQQQTEHFAQANPMPIAQATKNVKEEQNHLFKHYMTGIIPDTEEKIKKFFGPSFLLPFHLW